MKMRTHPLRQALQHLTYIALLCGVGAMQTSCAATDEAAWTLAGQQGLVRFVIVPLALAREQAAYEKQIKQLCEPERTCFLNFYTNSTKAALVLPLPDAIDKEATAVYRRSSKQGAERFQWSCRLKINNDPCF
jgi:hypothetical protein